MKNLKQGFLEIKRLNLILGGLTVALVISACGKQGFSTQSANSLSGKDSSPSSEEAPNCAADPVKVAEIEITADLLTKCISPDPNPILALFLHVPFKPSSANGSGVITDEYQFTKNCSCEARAAVCRDIKKELDAWQVPAHQNTSSIPHLGQVNDQPIGSGNANAGGPEVPVAQPLGPASPLQIFFKALCE